VTPFEVPPRPPRAPLPKMMYHLCVSLAPPLLLQIKTLQRKTAGAEGFKALLEATSTLRREQEVETKLQERMCVKGSPHSPPPHHSTTPLTRQRLPAVPRCPHPPHSYWCIPPHASPPLW
jgi:hypothetical protein